MNNFKYTSLLVLSSFLSVYSLAFTDGDIEEITDRLEGYSQSQLEDRREFLVAVLDENVEDVKDCMGVVGGTSVINEDGVCTEVEETDDEELRAFRLLELSIVEQALILLGVGIADNLLSDDDDNDTEAPVITIQGDNPATVELGDSYTDAGATATDNSGSAVVTSSGSVDTSAVGSYTITYTATDPSGNSSTATRTVNVVDTTAPVVVVTGTDETVELGDTYTDVGATASDASGTLDVVVSGSVDTNTIGTYTITYTATDASGNSGSATRTVTVVDTTPPVFVSTGNFTMDENSTAPIGTLSATDLGNLTYSMGDGGSVIEVTEGGVLSFSSNALATLMIQK